MIFFVIFFPQQWKTVVAVVRISGYYWWSWPYYLWCCSRERERKCECESNRILPTITLATTRFEMCSVVLVLPFHHTDSFKASPSLGERECESNRILPTITTTIRSSTRSITLMQSPSLDERQREPEWSWSWSYYLWFYFRQRLQ